jgi:hypothetical protein
VTENIVTITIGYAGGANTRQPCVACGGETWRHPVQAFVWERDNPIPLGAICEVCLRRPSALLIPRLAEPPDVLIVEQGAAGVPTLSDLQHAREVCDREIRPGGRN